MLTDTHAHVYSEYYDDIDFVLNESLLNGINRVICSGVDLRTNQELLKLINEYDNMFATLGIHPESADTYTEEDLKYVEEHINDPKVVAIGEIGLDYYWRKDNKEEQIKVFEAQIELAKKYNLPIVVHCRDAYGDVLDILKQYAPYDNGGVIHCYSGSIEWARQIIQLGFLISFTGVVTYSNAVNVQEVAKWVDDDKFMVETDSPFLTPVPFRGKKNNPSYTKYTLEYIAKLKNKNIKELDKITTKNAIKLFNLKIK